MKKKLLLVFLSLSAMGAGYEKVTTWSGKYASLAGSAVAHVDDSEALFFNPAGIADIKSSELSYNLSPTVSKFSGPVDTNTGVEEGEKIWSAIQSLTYGRKLNKDFSYAVGFYTAAGTTPKYENVSVSTGPNADVNTRIVINELGLGLGYRINKNLKAGLNLRTSFVEAEFNAVGGASSVTVAKQYRNLKDTVIGTYRLGLQYEGDNKDYALGVMYRSELKADVEGDSMVHNSLTGSTYSPVKATTYLPQQITFGGYKKLSQKWKGFAEYVWTEYGVNKEVFLDAANSNNDATVTQQWRNQTNIRLAAEYASTWAYRYGYAWTSQVVPERYARATFSSPGVGHTLTFGMGKENFFKNLDFNWGVEYSFADGDVDSSDGNTSANSSTAYSVGNYSTYAYAVHLGAKYRF